MAAIVRDQVGKLAERTERGLPTQRGETFHFGEEWVVGVYGLDGESRTFFSRAQIVSSQRIRTRAGIFDTVHRGV